MRRLYIKISIFQLFIFFKPPVKKRNIAFLTDLDYSFAYHTQIEVKIWLTKFHRIASTAARAKANVLLKQSPNQTEKGKSTRIHA
jgi:hypothetical protein